MLEMAIGELPEVDQHTGHADFVPTTAPMGDVTPKDTTTNEQKGHDQEAGHDGTGTDNLPPIASSSNPHDLPAIPSFNRASSMLQLPPLSLPSTTLDTAAVTGDKLDHSAVDVEQEPTHLDDVSSTPLPVIDVHPRVQKSTDLPAVQGVDGGILKTVDPPDVGAGTTPAHDSTVESSTGVSQPQNRGADEFKPAPTPTAAGLDTKQRPLLRSESTTYEVAPALGNDAAIAQQFLDLGPPSVPAQQGEGMHDFDDVGVTKQNAEAAQTQSHVGSGDSSGHPTATATAQAAHDPHYVDVQMQEVSQPADAQHSSPPDSQSNNSYAVPSCSEISDSATSSTGMAFAFSNSSDVKATDFDFGDNIMKAPVGSEPQMEVPPAREPASTSAGLVEQTPTPNLTPYHGFNDNPNLPELDVDSNETDSALGDMRAHSSTASVRSSLYEYVEEHGRTYHRYKAGSYFLPNDEEEQNRLDMQHHLWTMTLHGELNLAPLGDDVMDVLDVATGTGIWAIDFATKHPSATVVGTDLSPIQPPYVPPNCKFEVDDAEDEWMYNHNFDYIHGRLLLTCFRDFKGFMQKCYDNLNPGGWLELADYLPITCHDNSWEGTEIQRWVHTIIRAAQKLGSDWEKADKYARWAEEIGFVNVNEVQLAHPTNTWPRTKHHKQLGVWMNQNMSDGVHGISAALLTRGLGMTRPEIEVLCMGFRKDLSDKNIHCYAPVRIVYCQKPM